MKTIRTFLFFTFLFVAFSHESQAAKVHAKMCVAACSQKTTVTKVQHTVSLTPETTAISESSVLDSYHQITQAYVQGAREQSHAFSNSLQELLAMLTATRMLWVWALAILLVFARL